jgi:arsenate reductase (thioredoxin)
VGLPQTILFLCPHNAAKSVLAAADFDRMARERGLDYQSISAGTDPDDRPSPAVVATLRGEGIDVAGHRPRAVTLEDVTNAHRVISLGCDVRELPPFSVQVERWDDVPPVSQDLAVSRAAIRRHLETLLDQLKMDDQ